MNKSVLRKFFLLLGDWVLLYASLFILVLIRYGGDWLVNWNLHFRPFSIIFPLWILSIYGNYLYETRFFRQNLDAIRAMGASIFIALITSISAFYLFPPGLIYPRRNLVIFAFIYGIVVVVWRFVFYKILHNSIETRLLFLGGGNEVKELVNFFKNNSHLKYNNRGIFDKPPSNFKEVAEKIREEDIRLVVVKPDQRSHSIRNLFPLLSSNVAVIELSAFYEQIFNKVAPGLADDAWFIKNMENVSLGVYEFGKRVVDSILGFFGTILFLIFYILLGTAIKLESRGSVIFRQKRIGKSGKVFYIYKFRSMEALNPDGSAEIAGPTWAKVGDNRITKTGGFMRKIRLDELPQFWNILKGDMSFVGPRPERPEFVESLAKEIPYYNMRHLVKPGLTGWAQINYKYGDTVKDARIKLEYDIFYAKKRSLVLDLAIVLKTLKIVLTGKGQ
ncbi:MAG: sugar transferase [Patescibacteria group bacterium]